MRKTKQRESQPQSSNPPGVGGGEAAEALQFIITFLRYAGDRYGMPSGQHSARPLQECTHTWLQVIGQDVNPQKSDSFIITDSPHTVQMRGTPFPKETEFHSLGAKVRTTSEGFSGPPILIRIS